MYQGIRKTEVTANKSSTMECRDHFKNGASLKSRMSRENITQRTFLFFSVFCINVASVFAQDVITLKNGENIRALVLEIGKVDIKYKKFSNLNGPTYTLNKSEIFMIRYANGSKEMFADYAAPSGTSTSTPIIRQPKIKTNEGEVYFNFWGTLKYRSDKTKVKNVETLFYDIPEAAKNYRSGKTWYAIGGGIVGVGFCIGFWDILFHVDNNTYNNHNSFSCPTYWTGMGIMLVGGIFNQVGWSKQTTAVDLYNASIRRQQTSDFSLYFGITHSGGIGLTLNF